jgi:D-alanyl-D-alanine carboxypeptidase/D-alanyl-D-alanine-endopeptidase (penicillin-binding protein 4)
MACLALLFAGHGAAQDATPDRLPAPVLAALKQQRMSPGGMSVYVREIGNPLPLIAHGADTPRNPASAMKLLTTLVSLEKLGPAYTWKTEAYAGAPVRNGHLAGDLYIKGYGDPYLVIEHFWRFLRALRNSGLEVIDGDLVLDQSYFAPVAEDAGDFDGRPLRAYNVQPHALLVNFQAVNIRFLPDAETGRVQIVTDLFPS